MSLLQLPPETLQYIFSHIGPSFFHEDLYRLTVCKQWLHYAHPVFLRRVTLSQSTVKQMVLSEMFQKPSILERSLESLELHLERCQDISSPCSKNDTEATSSKQAQSTEDIAKDWNKALNESLVQLGILAKRCIKLHNLSIRAWNSSIRDIDSRTDFLLSSTVEALLSLDNLTVLILDLSTGFLDSTDEKGVSCHICPVIGALLNGLRTLHLRSHTICSAALQPPNLDQRLRLSTIVVNLSLLDSNISGRTAAAHSKPCSSSSSTGLLQLKADLQTQAEALTNRMTSPIIARILTHSLPRFEMNSFDVLTQKTMILDDSQRWDEDGKVLSEENSTSESELSDDEFNHFLDSD